MKQLNWLTATQAAQGIRDGLFSSQDLVRDCVAQIQEREPEVQAWAYFDAEHALAQAKLADDSRAAGTPLGPLHGVPVGIKDIIDTGDMPTEDGTVLHSGRNPWHDAKVVDLLRSAGAIIMGKTVTTELATYAPGKTRNPHNPEHTPGGSSSGSAAAVAAGMVPLAIGTQTNGSLIRPAAYCGVFGFKPTRGLISRQGILRQSERLDQPGGFAQRRRSRVAGRSAVRLRPRRTRHDAARIGAHAAGMQRRTADAAHAGPDQNALVAGARRRQP
jgi:Asp-tRNA(Asn)/Glu-tRNA(Gln) amidotransferase A subunit family amidase